MGSPRIKANLSTYETSGIDFQADYGFATSFGLLDLRVSGTCLDAYDYLPFNGGETVKLAGNFSGDPAITTPPSSAQLTTQSSTASHQPTVATEPSETLVIPIVSPSEVASKSITLATVESADEFGQPKSNPNPLQEISAKVQGITSTTHKKLGIRLANLQVWQQLDALRMNLHAGDQVSIRRARLNSYLLSKSSGGRSIRVKRVK